MSNKKNSNNKLTFADQSPVFKFINPNDNDKLSEMSGFDLQDLIILIDEYYLELREKLGLKKDITFGLELEFENAMINRISEKLKENFPSGEWKMVDDSSLHNGAEINSPILIDNEKNWQDLDKVCQIVSKSAKIGKNSGGHIHIGTQTLGKNKQSWLNFIKTWSVYENIIFRFTYGEFLTSRSSILEYAEPVSKSFWKAYKNLNFDGVNSKKIISLLSHEKYQAVNLENVSYNCNKIAWRNTIEFRSPNGTLNPVIWQNNVNFFVHFLKYCKSKSFDDDLVEKRHRLNKFQNLKWYDEIYLEQALELCDMIFTNNFDKVYFLRQYLKSFQVYKKDAVYPQKHILTKNKN